jgi:diacylglycerol kinase family enzyme
LRKAALLFNPASGGGRKPRRAALDACVALLRRSSVEADLIPCQSSEHARQQAREAIDSGCDTIFACGGDGTVHDLIQVLAATDVAMAVLPMGTANALAHDLKLSFDLVKATQAALSAKPRRIALGRVEYLNLEGKPASSYFIVTAGAGVDAHLFHKLRPEVKQRMGMAAYYAKAWSLWFNHKMIRFEAAYTDGASGETRQLNLTELMAVRIRNFGGILQELAPGASLDRNDLRLVMCRTSSRIAYLAYVMRGMLRRNWKISGIDLADSKKVSCKYANQESRVYIEADGELLGTLPAEMTIVPNALTLLAP